MVLDWRRVVLAVAIAGIVTLINVCLLRGETITVRVQSGRAFTAEVDPRSNAERLWLRFDRDGATVWRPIDWERVTSVERGGQVFTTDDARRNIAAWTVGQPGELPPPAPPGRNPPVRPASASVQQPLPVRAASLHISAELAKWQAGVEDDGLLVRIYPVDANGNLVPVEATVEIDLIGESYNQFQPLYEFPKLGRWAEALHSGDLTPDGYVLRLRFQAVHPEFNTEFGSFGLVHARLTVAGAGAFDATTRAVRVRPYNAIRDRLEQREGTRFFPNEWTSR